MNYYKHYIALCLSRQRRKVAKDVYTETHHIVPRCKGGSNSPENLVELTPREHYLAHLLLWKANPNDVRLYWPLQWFITKEGTRIPSRVVQLIKQDRQRFVGLRDYSWTKELEHRKKLSFNMCNLWSDRFYQSSSYRQEQSYRDHMSTQTSNCFKQNKRQKNKKDPRDGKFISSIIVVDNIRYESLTAAAKSHGISIKAAYNRVKKDTWPNWNKGE